VSHLGCCLGSHVTRTCGRDIAVGSPLSPVVGLVAPLRTWCRILYPGADSGLPLRPVSRA
jgi:hypothetical protein